MAILDFAEDGIYLTLAQITKLSGKSAKAVRNDADRGLFGAPRRSLEQRGSIKAFPLGAVEKRFDVKFTAKQLQPITTLRDERALQAIERRRSSTCQFRELRRDVVNERDAQWLNMLARHIGEKILDPKTFIPPDPKE